VIQWSDRSDVELFIEEPNGETCHTFHNITSKGGLVSVDCPCFGPQEYILRKVSPGEYKIWVKLFHTIFQNPTGSIVTISIFQQYGGIQETGITTNVRLVGNKQVYHVATVNVI